MTNVYKVQGAYFFSLNKAINYAKKLIRNNYGVITDCSEEWKVTQGKHNGYCVTCVDDWQKVGDISLLKMGIQTISVI